MKGFISIYLDLLRFLAAMGVFLWHAGHAPLSSGVLPQVYFNHKLVIIFFVISGYVIAASASRPGRTLADYTADRLARLSSVVIPALVLTYCLDIFGAKFSPEVYSSVNFHWQPLRFLTNFFYCQQIWFFCVNPSSNNPFWSLGYEFWYYVLFGIWVFIRSGRTKLIMLLGVCLFIGPKILLLLPAWVAGAVAFHASQAWRGSFRGSLLLFVVTGVVTVLALVGENHLGLNNGRAGQPPLYYSSNFIGDNLFAGLLAGHFLCCALVSRHLSQNLEGHWGVAWTRWLAGHTFSLYVYHLPLLLFLRAVTKYDPSNAVEVLVTVVVVLLSCAGLARLTEDRYPAFRSHARQWLGGVIAKSPVHAPERKTFPAPTENIPA